VLRELIKSFHEMVLLDFIQHSLQLACQVWAKNITSQG
jgi:hypothetical protein